MPAPLPQGAVPLNPLHILRMSHVSSISNFLIRLYYDKWPSSTLQVLFHSARPGHELAQGMVPLHPLHILQISYNSEISQQTGERIFNLMIKTFQHPTFDDSFLIRQYYEKLFPISMTIRCNHLTLKSHFIHRFALATTAGAGECQCTRLAKRAGISIEPQVKGIAQCKHCYAINATSQYV